MCGFYGVLGGGPELFDGAPQLTHRGPDSMGEARSGPFYVRHFRLAILGGAEDAAQPMASEDGSTLLAFNGEIYNYKELAEWMGRPELAARGDTRVLAEFLARHGLSKLSMLNGMFAIAAFFPLAGELALIRDRFGVKPLHYARLPGGALLFASEIKAFAAAMPLKLDMERVADWLDAGLYPPPGRTFFAGVLQVDGGETLRANAGGLRVERWYDLRAECLARVGSPGSVDEYEALLADSTRLRLRSDVPVSLHYSGGTDSTALLLKTKEVWGWDYPLVAWTGAFDEEEFDESRFTEAQCAAVGVSNVKVRLSHEEVPALAEELHRFMDEPYAGVPTILYYKLNLAERAAGYIVSIEGQGGDETFGGYKYHAFMAMRDLMDSGKDPGLLAALLAHYKVEAPEAARVAERLLASGFQSHTDLTDFRAAARPSAAPAEKFVDWLTTVQLRDFLVNKIPRTMRFNDRASAACGREVRFPLLDYRAVACGLSFGHSLKMAGGTPKAPLREIIRRHLPAIHAAPKRAVVTPQTAWLKGPLAPWLRSRVDALRARGVLPPRHFEAFEAFAADPNPRNSFFPWQLANLSFFEDRNW